MTDIDAQGYQEPSTAGFWRKFRDWNVDLSFRTTPHWLWEGRAFGIFEWVGRGLLSDPSLKKVADVGGGRTWHFGGALSEGHEFELYGIDVDANELSLNKHLDHAIATDCCVSFGVPENSLDLVLSRATVEHLPDTAGFLENAFKSLRPGGRAGLVFASKWAPPMILNRIIGNRIANILLHKLVPGTAGYGGFKAHYDKCTYGQFKRAALDAGFEIEYDYCSYYSSSYFQFFLPIHVFSILLDCVRQLLSIRGLASMNLFVIKKPDGS